MQPWFVKSQNSRQVLAAELWNQEEVPEGSARALERERREKTLRHKKGYSRYLPKVKIADHGISGLILELAEKEDNSLLTSLHCLDLLTQIFTNVQNVPCSSKDLRLNSSSATDWLNNFRHIIKFSKALSLLICKLR